MGQGSLASQPTEASAEETLHTLLGAVQELSLAEELEDVQRVVRTAARHLVAADGATFVLRDGDKCFYADEDAVSPLWKGKRFPLTQCISGWTMLNRTPAVIDDIYQDSRIPHDAYRPTFVNSLMMVPIRTAAPLGAIGMYWADRHMASAEEVAAARALADSTAVALEHLQTKAELARTTELSETDALTGLPNRRAWDTVLGAALAAPSQPLCVALVDLDHFKSYNDRLGHQAGDELLRRAASAWRGAVRASDVVARYGGEEFAVLMASCDMERAREIADRLRTSVPDGVTASVGLACWDGAEDAPALVSRADGALYEAKESGRDRVEVAD